MYTWGYIKDCTLAKLDLDEMEANEQELLSRFPFFANEAMTQICSTVKPNHTFVEFVITKDLIGVPQSMPSDFISFGSDINKRMFVNEYDEWIEEDCYENIFSYRGYNKIVFNRIGKYTISYNARWFTFDKDLDNDAELDVPTDILDCLPSYIAHQCYKVDDETKAAIYRNEFEMMFARIDDTYYKSTQSIKINGDW